MFHVPELHQSAVQVKLLSEPPTRHRNAVATLTWITLAQIFPLTPRSRFVCCRNDRFQTQFPSSPGSPALAD